jgi:hypothetical protein
MIGVTEVSRARQLVMRVGQLERTAIIPALGVI